MDFGVAAESREIKGRERWRIPRALLVAGFRRIGLYDRHYHADVDEELPTEVIWVGESQ